MSTTSEPESEEVMKKTATSRIAMTDSTCPSGMSCSTVNSTFSATTPSVLSTRPPSPKS